MMAIKANTAGRGVPSDDNNAIVTMISIKLKAKQRSARRPGSQHQQIGRGKRGSLTLRQAQASCEQGRLALAHPRLPVHRRTPAVGQRPRSAVPRGVDVLACVQLDQRFHAGRLRGVSTRSRTARPARSTRRTTTSSSTATITTAATTTRAQAEPLESARRAAAFWRRGR
jgi:hypothetical protein